MSQRVVITGGQGDLAKVTKTAFEKVGDQIFTPGREECDVTEETSISRYFREAGDLDLLICNAGIGQEKLIVRTSHTEAMKILDTNLSGSFLSARIAAKLMLKKRTGHIIFISSYLAEQSQTGQAIYSSSKAAINGLTKSLALELGSRNVRVNAVMPGFLDTKMTSGLSKKVKEDVQNAHCLKRLNTCESVADFLVFLHHHLPHTSGQIFSLDSRPLP